MLPCARNVAISSALIVTLIFMRHFIIVLAVFGIDEVSIGQVFKNILSRVAEVSVGFVGSVVVSLCCDDDF